MRSTFALLTIILLSVFLTGCATLMGGSRSSLSIKTSPGGAKVEVTNKKGKVVYTGFTPATMFLRAGAGYFSSQRYRVTLTKNGYADKIITVGCKLNAWYLGNIILGGTVGMVLIDPLTGAMFKLDREYISETLTPNAANAEPSLMIMDVNQISPDMKAHLVTLK